MLVQEQMEICNVIKNTFLLQVHREPIALQEVAVKVPQAGLTEGVQVARLNHQFHHEAVQAVFQDHLEPQAEAQVGQVAAVVVLLPHQAGLHLKDNLKNLL